MITNFEQITSNLNAEERSYINPIVEAIQAQKEPIKSNELIRYLEKHYNLKLEGRRLRKITNYIRSNGMYPIIATSNGYSINYNEQDIKKQIKSLRERASAINNSAQGLEKILHKLYLKD